MRWVLTTPMDPDYERGDVAFLDVLDALERSNEGEIYQSVARGMPNITLQTIRNIDTDDKRHA